MQARIEAARNVGKARGVPLVINARADGYILGGKGEDTFTDTIDRGRAWLEAGADCVFVPAVVDLQLISRLAAHLPGPLNVLVTDDTMPPVAELAKAGARRISCGPRLAQVAYGALAATAQAIAKDGDFASLAGAPGFAALNGLVGT
jgi:2-methylisocitrate lyase-like PEP mutase family enzyme